jgi:hypothetical protein
VTEQRALQHSSYGGYPALHGVNGSQPLWLDNARSLESDGDSLHYWFVQFRLKIQWSVDDLDAFRRSLVRVDKDGTDISLDEGDATYESLRTWTDNDTLYRLTVPAGAGSGGQQSFASFLGKDTWDAATYRDPGFIFDNQTGVYTGPDDPRSTVQCVSPLDSGDSPPCGGTQLYSDDELSGEGTPSLSDPGMGKCLYRHITIKTDEIFGTQLVDTERSPYYPRGCCEAIDDTKADYCVPWTELSGLFFGDGTYQSVDFILKPRDMMEMYGRLVVSADATAQHVYKRPRRSDVEPYVAFFMAGPRTRSARISPAGSARLETTVNLQPIQCATDVAL